MLMDMDSLRGWLGRTESRDDHIALTPVAALSATLDRTDPAPREGDVLQPLWHWLYFLPLARQSEIGRDGHPKLGGFLPPIPLPRRMWAGGRLQFHHPLRVSDRISRVSQIVDLGHKEGRTGSLVFVLVRHQISNGEGVAVTEEHDIVYRENTGKEIPATEAIPAPLEHDWTRQIRPDEVMLFRYSALTFNSHRIHYDRPYVTKTEGYPGLVVHGPLIATLLLDLLRRNRPDAVVLSFSFRAVKPLFDTTPFSVCGASKEDGKTVELWAKDVGGALAMKANATLI